VRHVGDTYVNDDAQVRWCGTMQCTVRQRRHLENNSLRYAEPMKADERVGDVVATSQVENEPCCDILD